MGLNSNFEAVRFRGDLVSVGYEWAVSSVGAGSGQ